MRKLEFRLFDATSKKMYYMPNIGEYTIEQIFRFAETDDQYTKVMQFTGLLDKNGTKIFEGDILKIKYTSCTGDVHFYDPKDVKWIDEACGFNISHGIDCEVIGNIHEGIAE